MDEKQEIPKEIDDHFKLFGKDPWEIEYGDKCCLLYTSPSPRD